MHGGETSGGRDKELHPLAAEASLPTFRRGNRLKDFRRTPVFIKSESGSIGVRSGNKDETGKDSTSSDRAPNATSLNPKA